MQPRLTQRQVREIGGVLLLLVGLLGLLAVASNQGSILAGIRDWQYGWLKVLKTSGDHVREVMKRDLGVAVDIYQPEA